MLNGCLLRRTNEERTPVNGGWGWVLGRPCLCFPLPSRGAFGDGWVVVAILLLGLLLLFLDPVSIAIRFAVEGEEEVVAAAEEEGEAAARAFENHRRALRANRLVAVALGLESNPRVPLLLLLLRVLKVDDP